MIPPRMSVLCAALCKVRDVMTSPSRPADNTPVPVLMLDTEAQALKWLCAAIAKDPDCPPDMAAMSVEMVEQIEKGITFNAPQKYDT